MAINEKGKGKDSVTFEIEEHIGVLSTNQTSGWRKELNLVAWNGNAAKYDLRDWDPEHEHMSKGITLHKDEVQQLFELLKERKL